MRTTHFNDEFSVLFAVVDLRQYEALRKRPRQLFHQIAETLSELGPYIRFVACELDMSPAPEDAGVQLSRIDIGKLVNQYIGVSGGYLGDFSYKTHADFYPEYCDLDINPYDYNGTTRERFMTILEQAEPSHQARIIRGILTKYPAGSSELRTQERFTYFQSLVNRLEGDKAVENPTPAITSTVVSQVLDDAEALIRQRGPTSAVDRVHTALHGYLLAVCKSAGLQHGRDASLTELYKVLRKEHPAFSDLGVRSEDINKILKASTVIMDVLNPLRNKASVAHPNSNLLGQDEAMLVVNISRTLIHYLDAKFSSQELDGTPIESHPRSSSQSDGEGKKVL